MGPVVDRDPKVTEARAYCPGSEYSQRHEWRLLATYQNRNVFYCVHCLKQVSR